MVIERIKEVFTAVDNISNDVTLSPTSIPRVIMAECVELDLKGDAKARPQPFMEKVDNARAATELHKLQRYLKALTTTAGKKIVAATAPVATKVAQDCDKAIFIMDNIMQASEVTRTVHAMRF